MINYKDYEVLNDYIADTLLDQITGKSTSRILCFKNRLDDYFFIGQLSPQIQDIADDRKQHESRSKISQLGVEFLFAQEQSESSKAFIYISGKLFYRVTPSLQEQRCYWLATLKEANNVSAQKFEDLDPSILDKKSLEHICDVAKVYVSKEYSHGHEIEMSKALNSTRETISIKDESFSDFENSITNSETYYKRVREKVAYKDLASEESWNEFLRLHQKEKIPLGWSFSININSRLEEPGLSRICVKFRNDTVEPSADRIYAPEIFDAKLKISFHDRAPVPIRLREFLDDFKYNREVYGVGVNCYVESELEGRQLQTSTVPRYTQTKIKTKNYGLDVSFINLSKNPLFALEQILSKLKDQVGDIQKNLDSFVASLKRVPSSSTKQQIVEDQKAISFEVERFENGISVLREFPLVLEAFKLMNEAFSVPRKAHKEWRLFQIVYIVSALADFAKNEYPQIDSSTYEDVDLIYFPTGGGKTEAFLGLIVFNLFFDRLRGKNFGTSGFVKYPLRLLSIQQTQRIADVVAAAETIRRRVSKISSTSSFSVGYFVGEGNTPNKIDSTEAEYFKEASPATLTSKFKILTRCPFCTSSNIVVMYESTSNRLIHSCSDCTEGVLPIFIVDREIFRYLPSVVVSTIDKFTAIGFQKSFRGLLGAVQGHCKEHGYSVSRECIERKKACSDNGNFQLVSFSNFAPTFMIQDELHMLTESLGVYDAHYETFINKYINDLSPGDKNHLKYICATATLSNYENQVWHLYLKRAVRFPCPPIIPNQSLYYENTEDINRRFYGLSPVGISPMKAVQEISKYQRLILSNLLGNKALVEKVIKKEIDQSELIKLIRTYWIILEYGLKKNDAIDICDTLSKTINSELSEHDQFITENLTGDKSLDEVIQIVDRIENSQSDLPSPNFIASTSMISHGVDIELFNFMILLSVPQSMGEYIQATSRAGRSFPATIFTVFLSNREKDKSYHRFFTKFNELKDVLIEPVAIDRWVHNAIKRSLPGIVYGFILQYFDHISISQGKGPLYMATELKSAMADNTLFNLSEFISLVSDSYGVNFSSSDLHKQKIKETVEWFFERYKDIIIEKPTFITTSLPEFRPMMSLRDTDEALEISHDGTDASKTMRRGRVQSLYKHFPGSWINFKASGVEDVCQVSRWFGLPYKDNELNHSRVFSRINKVLAGYKAKSTAYPSELGERNAIVLNPRKIFAGKGSETYFCTNRTCRKAFYLKPGSRNKKCLDCGRVAVQMPLIYYCECGESQPVKLIPCKTQAHGFDHMRFIESGSRREWVCKLCKFKQSLYFKKCYKCRSIMTLSNIGGTKVAISRTLSFIDLIDTDEEKVLEVPEGRGQDLVFAKNIGLITDVAYRKIAKNMLNPSDDSLRLNLLESELQKVMEKIPDRELALDILKKVRSELFESTEEDFKVLDEIDSSVRVSAPDREAHAVAILERDTIASYENKITVAGALGKTLDFKLKRDPIDYKKLQDRFGLTDIVASEDISMVLSLYGYSREHYNISNSVLNNFSKDVLMEMDPGIAGRIPVYLLKYRTEGMLFDFDKRKIIEWCLKNKFLDEVKDNLPEDLGNEIDLRKWWLTNVSPSSIEFYKDIDAQASSFTKLVYSLLHTISHSLIRNIETVSGLSKGSLSEYLIPTTSSVLIYTHNTHENPLGVFESIMINSLDTLLENAYASLSECINDPVCATYFSDKKTTASCFDCCYVAEVSCQHMNFDLDRRLVVGGEFVPLGRIKGFWEV